MNKIVAPKKIDVFSKKRPPVKKVFFKEKMDALALHRKVRLKFFRDAVFDVFYRKPIVC